jgi:hypothetical protein
MKTVIPQPEQNSTKISRKEIKTPMATVLLPARNKSPVTEE